MSDTPPAPRIGAKDLITIVCAVVGATCVVAGAIRKDGQTELRVDTGERRLTAVEARLDSRDDLLSRIDVRTAKIETKLEMMGAAK